MTNLKLLVRSKYEKCKMLFVWPIVEGTNKIIKTYSVKNTCLSILKKNTNEKE